MSYLLEIPRLAFPEAPPVQAVVPALAAVAQSKGALVPVASDTRSLTLAQIAGQDPFLARKLVTPQRGVASVTPHDVVTATVARAQLQPDELRRFNAIADGLSDVATQRVSTNRTLRLTKTFALLGYGAFLASGAAFDPAVYVGVAGLVAFTLGKLHIENRGARRVSDRYSAMHAQLEALPAVTDDPLPEPVRSDEGSKDTASPR